MQYQNHL